MPILRRFCKTCNQMTPHAEDAVPDIESATVWHCLFCGRESRPNEPGSPNEPAKTIPPPKGGGKSNIIKIPLIT